MSRGMSTFKKGQGAASALPSQHVPAYLICAAVLLIPVAVACVNYIMVLTDLYLMQLKFSTAQDVMASAGVGAGTAVLLGISTLLALLAASLVNLVAPICAGSGIPEVLGFLNGNNMPDLFTLRGFCVRTAAIVFVQVAGFPVGREGPMVAIGGSVGFGVAWLLLRPQEKRWDEVVAAPGGAGGSVSLSTATLVVNEERFAHVRRVGCALGGAAGIATAFNAPIGSILYMFEELAVSSLPPDLARFMCTVFASLMARALLQVTQLDVHRLVIYDENAMNADGGWDWADIPLVVVLSAVLGCAGALFSKALLASWRLRKRSAARLSAYQPWAKIVECGVYCALCSLAWGLVPALFECRSIAADGDAAPDEGHHRLLSGESHLNYVQYDCPDGQYSEVATYFLSGAEGAIKHLYSQSGGAQRSGPLAVALVFYFTLACGMPGLSVPMGTFVPSMLTGALAGRLFGENLNLLTASLHGPALAPAGVYAVVGSAAMLAGLTHMTVGIVALLAEAIGNFGLIAPLMLSVFVAQMASRLISDFGYDEHLIIMKGIPFLDPEIPKEMETEGLTAADLCDVLPDEALLPSKATTKAVKRALRQRHVKYFPIIAEGSICIGLTTRGRLRAVLQAVSQSHQQQGGWRAERRPSVDSTGSASSEGSLASSEASSNFMSSPSSRRSMGHLADVQAEAKLSSFIKVMFAGSKGNVEDQDSAKDAQDLLPLDRIMDSAPHAFAEDMPVSRFYNIFNKTGVHVAIVVSKRGRFRGILTRMGLIEAQAKLHAGSHTVTGHDSANPPSKKHAPDVSEQQLAFQRDVSADSQHSGNASLKPTNQLSETLASAVARNMRPEELPEELARAWKRIAEWEQSQDELREQLKASEQRNKDLELQLFGAQAQAGSRAAAPQPGADACTEPPVDAQRSDSGAAEQGLTKISL